MTITAISGAAAALASLQAQASATPATTDPTTTDPATMSIATANAILADYIKSGNKPNHYTQAQTDGAAQFIDNQIAAATQQAGGNAVAGTVAFLQSVPADQQDTTFYGLSINGTTLTFAQDLAVNQAVLGAGQAQTAMLRSGAIAYDANGNLVGTSADGTTVIGILGLLASSDPTKLLQGAQQWSTYAAGQASAQDTVSVSSAAQATTAAGTDPADLESPDGFILQLSAALNSGNSALVDGAIQGLAGIVLDLSLSWSMADQQTAQTALGYIQAAEPYLNLSTADTQLIAQATQNSVYDLRVAGFIGPNGMSEPSAIEARFEFDDTGEQAYGATNYNLTGDKTLDVFESLSPADQQAWFNYALAPQGYTSIWAYTTNLQANDAINSVIQQAVANGTMTDSWEPYAQIKDPLIAAAQKLLQTVPTTSAAFTAQAAQVVEQLNAAESGPTMPDNLPASAMSFLKAVSTPPTAAEQALQTLQSGPSAADQAALDTLKNVLQQMKAQAQKQQQAASGTTKTGAPATATIAPSSPTSITFSTAKPGTGTGSNGTGLAILSETIGTGAIIDATV